MSLRAVCFKVPPALLTMIHEACRKLGYTSRSEFIRDAIRFYLAAKLGDINLREVREETRNGTPIKVVDIDRIIEPKRSRSR